ncbi:Endoglucanase 24 [Linum perenne]
MSKSIIFFQGHRSDTLTRDQRLDWRSDSGLSDGRQTYGVDLTGDYYDAGDNVKFGFPMAFTTTMLSWSIIEFASLRASQFPRHRPLGLRLPSQVRLPASQSHLRSDHDCWERPEDMDTVIRKHCPLDGVCHLTAALFFYFG